MVDIETAIQEFPKILEKYSSRDSKSDLEKVTEKIQTVDRINPAAYSNAHIESCLKQRAKVLYDLVEDYFTSAISVKFPLISAELFNLKRHITIESVNGKSRVLRDDTKPAPQETKKSNTNQKEKRYLVNAEIPLFAYTPLLKGEHKAKLGSFTQSKWDSYYRYTRKRTTQIEATLPGSIGSNLRQAYKEALGSYFDIMARTYSDPIVGELLLQNPASNADPEIGAIWIPTQDSLKISSREQIVRPKPVDPAMVLNVRGKKYLVKTWQVDDEEPFEHYLREYSVGNLKDKLSKKH